MLCLMRSWVWRRAIGCSPILLAATLALSLSACGQGRPMSVGEQIAAGEGAIVSVGDDIVVDIPPGALPSDTTITITRATEDDPAPAELEAATSVGPAFNIHLEGQELSKPVLLEVAFDPDLVPEDSPQDAVFLAFYDEEKNEWVPVDSTVDLDRHVVTVETDHLSWWNPFSWDLSELGDNVSRSIEGLLEWVGLPVADVPECEGSPKYMTVEFNDSLLACIQGTEAEGQAILRLANNRAYAVLIHLPPTVELRWASHGSLSDAAAAFLEENLGWGAVYIPPAGEAEFLLHFDDAGDIRLLSAPSDTTIALDILLTIFSMLVADPENVIDGMECLFEIMVPDTPEPRTAGDLLDVAKECVGVALKGRAGILWAAIRTFVTMGAATGELVVDRTFGSDTGEVTVTYRPPAPVGPATFTDPFAYCAAVGTVDWPGGDAGWVGPELPQAVSDGLERLLGSPPYPPYATSWRCVDGKVLACRTLDMHFVACSRRSTSREPTPEMVGFCQENPDSDIPFAVPGPRRSIYSWVCRAGAPAVVGQATSVDSRGFVPTEWHEIQEHGVEADLWEFAGQINQALAASDVAFFVERTIIQGIPCGWFGPVPPECEGNLDKEIMGIMDGVPGATVGAWTPPQYEENLQKWFGEVDDGAQDELGSGRFQLHGIMLKERPTLAATYMMTATLRQIVRFQLEQQQGQWRVVAVHWGRAAGPETSELLRLWETSSEGNYIKWPDFR